MDEIIDYVMTNPENTNPNVLRGMLENSSGSGDFSIAEVEIANYMGTKVDYIAPVIENTFMYSISQINDGGQEPFATVLFNGRNEVYIKTNYALNVDTYGNVHYNGSGMFTITGNGSIILRDGGK